MAHLLQSQMLSSLLSVAMPPSDDTPASQDSDSDDSSEDARIIDIFASPPTPKGKTEKYQPFKYCIHPVIRT